MIVKIEGSKSFIFPDNIEPSERLILINEMLDEVISLDGKEITVDDYFRDTFDVKGTRSNLEKISYYLSKMPEQSGRHDQEVLSKNDILEMEKGVRKTTKNGQNIVKESRYRNFSEVSKEDAVNLGIAEPLNE